MLTIVGIDIGAYSAFTELRSFSPWVAQFSFLERLSGYTEGTVMTKMYGSLPFRLYSPLCFGAYRMNSFILDENVKNGITSRQLLNAPRFQSHPDTCHRIKLKVNLSRCHYTHWTIPAPMLLLVI